MTAFDFNSSSDRNLKTNIQPVKDPIAKIVQINGVTFDWKANNQPAIGVIAQEIEEIFPELVSVSEINNCKTVKYNGLIGVLIEGIKDQQTQINTLKQEIENLKK